MKKVLITGSNGQLGKALNQQLKDNKNFQVINTDVDELDITKFSEVNEFVKKINPNIIINCAAHTAVDICEKQKDKAYRINAVGPKNLSVTAKEIGAVIVQVSTDYVFDGKKIGKYTESDRANPQSVYGQTKWEGEEFVRKTNEKHFIVRTAWLYGDGKNFVRTMLQLAENSAEIRVVEDQVGTPTSAKEVAKVIMKLVETENYGTYHATCEGQCSWADFSEEIFRLSRKDIHVKRITSEEYKTAAKRPQNSVLDNKNLREKIGYSMQGWEDALEEFIAEKIN
ncbi:dTDP-4-dehydrorhamnose reductase [Merdimonas faecis]|uniref:dTDP-4-dehydrorhamnose reductase n=1 Tax=Merdimonas faecis TaxID=1653435 RepID=UPI00086370EF|nr:dTDP-4-dehydrorhamnose reductase [Merdimonas faecis]